MTGAELRKYRLEFSTRVDSNGVIHPMKQSQFAKLFDVTQAYLSQMERGERPISVEFAKKVESFFRTYYESDVPVRVMFDYLRLSFFHTTPKTIIRDVLGMDYEKFVVKETGLYLFDRVAYYGNIWVFFHADKTENRNVLVQMSGQGCREYEMLLKERGSDWGIWLRKIWKNQSSVHNLYSRVQCTRLDIAFDELWYSDLEEHYDLIELRKKRRAGLLKTKFRRVRAVEGDFGEDDDGDLRDEGLSLYFGSRQSEVYFNFYEKRYELSRKNHISVLDALIEYNVYNRYEIRLSGEKASQAIDLFIEGKPLGAIAGGIIKKHITVYERCTDNIEEFLIIDKWWAKLFGQFEKVEFVMNPQPFSIEKTKNWLSNQVAPSLKAVREIEGLDYIYEMIEEAKMNEKQENAVKWSKGSEARKETDLAIW